jgi:HlyD family secretion protein
MTMNRNTRWLALAVGIAVAGVAAWALMPTPLAVDAAAVTRGAFEKTVDEDGKTRVRDRYVVSAPLAGRLLRLDLKAGAVVSRGTLVAVLVPAAPALLDARTEQELTERVGVSDAEKLRADANAERARVALGLAQSELARSQQLAAQGFISRQALERVEREVDLKAKELAAAEFDKVAAEHQRALARAALMRARSGRGAAGERFEIRSPVDGRVLRVAQESEAVVSIGAAIIELGDPCDLEVVVDVLTADAAPIRPGALARLDAGDGGPALEGRVRLIEPSAFTKVSALGVEEQRVNVVIDFVAPRDAWAWLGDGYRVDARIVVDQRMDAVLVPVGALATRRDGWVVHVVDQGRARTRSVDIGPRNASHAVVLQGLAAGDNVIVYPSDAVGDGKRVVMRRTQ